MASVMICVHGIFFFKGLMFDHIMIHTYRPTYYTPWNNQTSNTYDIFGKKKYDLFSVVLFSWMAE